jgi:hypothetical protein
MKYEISDSDHFITCTYMNYGILSLLIKYNWAAFDVFTHYMQYEMLLSIASFRLLCVLVARRPYIV